MKSEKDEILRDIAVAFRMKANAPNPEEHKRHHDRYLELVAAADEIGLSREKINLHLQPIAAAAYVVSTGIKNPDILARVQRPPAAPKPAPHAHHQAA